MCEKKVEAANQGMFWIVRDGSKLDLSSWRFERCGSTAVSGRKKRGYVKPISSRGSSYCSQRTMVWSISISNGFEGTVSVLFCRSSWPSTDRRGEEKKVYGEIVIIVAGTTEILAGCGGFLSDLEDKKRAGGVKAYLWVHMCQCTTACAVDDWEYCVFVKQ